MAGILDARPQLAWWREFDMIEGVHGMTTNDGTYKRWLQLQGCQPNSSTEPY